jgi:hypothetical protein
VKPKLPERFTLAGCGAGVPVCHCQQTDDGESGSVNVSGGSEPLEGVGGKNCAGFAETSWYSIIRMGALAVAHS